MGRRIDWIDDPQAPSATSVVPSANVIVVDDEGRILLIERTDSGNYALPGGALELGESIAETAVREAKEETGYDVEVTRLVGVYSDPDHRIEYTSDGEVRQEFTLVFEAQVTGGRRTLNDEASAVVWIRPTELDAYPMTASVEQRLGDYIAGEDIPTIA